MSKFLGRTLVADMAGEQSPGDDRAVAPVPLPRWAVPGAAGTPVAAEAVLPPGLTDGLRAVAGGDTAVLDAVFLAAHLRVLSALTSQQAPRTAFVPADGTMPPHPVGPAEGLDGSWRDVVARLERPRPWPEGTGGAAGPPYECVLDLSGTDPAQDGGASALWVGIGVRAGRVTIRARSRSDVMTEEHLTRITGYHARALELLAEDPDAPAGDGELLSDDERCFQLEALAGEEKPWDGRLFVERFEERVRQHPEAVAASHRDRSWTYGTLNAHANRIAHALLSNGLDAEDVVAVVMERGLEWTAATLGVLKAGGCYLPVQPDFPAARIAAQLDTADCRFVLGAGGHPDRAASGGRTRRTLDAASLCRDDVSGAADVDTVGNPGVDLAPDQLAYIYFTSGSTGTPKGVMCEHAGLLNHLLMKVEDLDIGVAETVAQTAVQSLDISLWQLIAPLLTGGNTRIVDTEVLLDVDRFVADLAGSRVSVVQLVPSYFDALITALERHPRDLGALRVVSVTGEELKREPVRRWFACQPRVGLVNAYGATELSDDTMHEILDRAPDSGFVTLGRMRRNVRGYVLDERGRLAPLGATGEIAFSGVAVGRGYANDPERTREVFCPDPFRPGQRMYRTGDFGRWLPGGRLQFLGRRDQQIKIRGFRIETGEIDNRLLAVNGVKDAAVVATTGNGRNKVLAAFLVGAGRVADHSVREALAGHLPDYMIPAYYHWLEALPLTESGKVDRKALVGLADTLGHADGPTVAPTTPTEQRLAVAWAEALNAPLQGIGRADDFFALGGTSLSAAWLVVKLDRIVSLAQIVAHPVLSDLAAAIDAGPGTAPTLLRPLSSAPAGRGAPAGVLVCFPGAGGNAINFLELARELAPSGIDVHGVELPGHDFVHGPQTLEGVDEVARRVADELGRSPAAPLLLWGQGEGAAHALALARLLEDGPSAPPHRVLVGGGVPGGIAGLRERMGRARAMSDKEVAETLLHEGAYVEFDGLKPERARLLGPAYRHDIRSTGDFLLAARQRPADHRIATGIDVVVPADGSGTPGVPGDRARDWRFLSDDVELCELPAAGQHFLRTRPADAAAAVTAALLRPPLRPREETMPNDDVPVSRSGDAGGLSGRIASGPDALLRADVLEPQLRFETEALLPGYIQLEKVLLLEYRRLGLLDGSQVGAVAALLDQITPGAVAEEAGESMSDIAFTLERYVSRRLDEVPPAWHVDRSRNDLQATAQLMYGRARLLDSAEALVAFGRTAHRLARRGADLAMPGYTHMQPAQVISPGFYFAGVCDQVLHTLERMESVYRTVDASPMGAGAMAGQELAWDRSRMAALLGFSRVRTHALRAVAQRDWALEACAEFSMLGVALSRFVTDLMTWGGAGHGFIDLPDQWSGISSAMPQKKNFPVLERIRARTAHLTAAYTDIATGQRNTPYSNSVEVSKEANAGVPAAFDTLESVLRLFGAVLENLEFRETRMRDACAAEYLGGFTLANLLTLRAAVPWRTAQVVAGRYIVRAVERGLPPSEPDGPLLEALLAEEGHHTDHAVALLTDALGVPGGLSAKTSDGSAHPDAVRAMLAEQSSGFDEAAERWQTRRKRIEEAGAGLDRRLTGREGRQQ
ncbi:amino acid adenylation domain-containing protein [Streptomyces parvus]|uniref:amino acid adenylation domain-containing protein n=1 Tax=Streptomyces parvus TaxID=66428 RepID=UPI003405FDD9